MLGVARSLLNTELVFGPISVPVSIHSVVTEDNETAFKMVCGAHDAPVKVQQKRACPDCASDDHVVRALEVGTGLVVVPEDVIKSAQAADKAAGERITLTVHPASEVEKLTRPAGARYYLGIGSKRSISDHYALMHVAIKSLPHLAFVAVLSIRGAAVPYRVVADDEGLSIQRLSLSPVVYARPEVTGEANQAYLDLVIKLAEQETTGFDESTYARPSVAIYAEYIADKTPVASGSGGDVLDLMSALKQSVKPVPKQRAQRARKAS